MNITQNAVAPLWYYPMKLADKGTVPGVFPRFQLGRRPPRPNILSSKENDAPEF